MRNITTRDLPDNLAEVNTLTSLGHLTKKSEKTYPASEEWRKLYHKAKRLGDGDAGFKLVTKLMEQKKDELRTLQQSLKGQKVTLVPVLSESNSKNVLPAAYALALERLLDAKICYEIEKDISLKLTDAPVQTRMAADLNFKGEPSSKEGKFIIIDDNFTTGKTILSLMEHLQEKGCEVHSVMTLASSRYSKRLKPTDEQIGRVLDELKLTNKDVIGICGHGLEKFTGAELQAIILNRCKDKREWFKNTYSRRVQRTSRGNETQNAGLIKGSDRRRQR